MTAATCRECLVATNPATCLVTHPNLVRSGRSLEIIDHRHILVYALYKALKVTENRFDVCTWTNQEYLVTMQHFMGTSAEVRLQAPTAVQRDLAEHVRGVAQGWKLRCRCFDRMSVAEFADLLDSNEVTQMESLFLDDFPSSWKVMKCTEHHDCVLPSRV